MVRNAIFIYTDTILASFKQKRRENIFIYKRRTCFKKAYPYRGRKVRKYSENNRKSGIMLAFIYDFFHVLESTPQNFLAEDFKTQTFSVFFSNNSRMLSQPMRTSRDSQVGSKKRLWSSHLHKLWVDVVRQPLREQSDRDRHASLRLGGRLLEVFHSHSQPFHYQRRVLLQWFQLVLVLWSLGESGWPDGLCPLVFGMRWGDSLGKNGKQKNIHKENKGACVYFSASLVNRQTNAALIFKKISELKRLQSRELYKLTKRNEQNGNWSKSTTIWVYWLAEIHQ